MAEAFNSLFKAECIRNPAMRPAGGWKSITDVEIATAEYVDWFNHRRLHGELGQVTPAEFETRHWSPNDDQPYPDHASPLGAGARQPSLCGTRGASVFVFIGTNVRGPRDWHTRRLQADPWMVAIDDDSDPDWAIENAHRTRKPRKQSLH